MPIKKLDVILDEVAKENRLKNKQIAREVILIQVSVFAL